MKAIASPCLEFFTCGSQRVGLCSRGVAIARLDTAFLGHHKAVGCGFRLAFAFQTSISAAAQTNAETEQVQTNFSEQCESVRVKFKLQKECTFGQEFAIVGDDPALGSWNPSDGVPLTWSEGHLWTTELDLPVLKLIKYKFILKGVVGAISWQPGPDRVLKTWNTENMISVFEDWDNHGLQNVVEEKPAADPKVTDSKSSSIAAENSNSAMSIKENPNTNGDTNNQVKHSAPVVGKKVNKRIVNQNLSSKDKGFTPMYQADSRKKEMTLGNNGSGVKDGSNSISSKDGRTLVKDEEAPVLVPGLGPVKEIREAELNKAVGSNNGSGVKDGSNSISSKDGRTLVKDEEAPVLVPGLGPVEEIREAELNKAVGSNETGVLAKPELNTESASAPASLHSGINGEMIIDEKQQPYDTEQLETNMQMITDGKQQPYDKQQPENVLETEMQWGKLTLWKFLSKFRFE